MTLTRFPSAGDVEPLEAVDHHQVGDVAWSNCSEIVEAEVLRRVDGRQSYRGDRVESLLDGHLDHVVDVSLLEKVLRMTVVGDEETPGQVAARDGRQKIPQVLRYGTLADHDVHPQPELLEHLVDRRTLVVRVYTRRDVCVQVLTRESRRVPVNALVLGHRDLVQESLVLAQHARIVHHLT
jgi:hypothetical protein